MSATRRESVPGKPGVYRSTDAQGKTFSTALLRMEIEVPDTQARALGIEG